MKLKDLHGLFPAAQSTEAKDDRCRDAPNRLGVFWIGKVLELKGALRVPTAYCTKQSLVQCGGRRGGVREVAHSARAGSGSTSWCNTLQDVSKIIWHKMVGSLCNKSNDCLHELATGPHAFIYLIQVSDVLVAHVSHIQHEASRPCCSNFCGTSNDSYRRSQ